MKNVLEIRRFFRKALNDVKQVIDQGAKDLGNILSKVIGLIQPGRDAVEDANQYFPELGSATNPDMDQMQTSLSGLLSNFSEEDQRDFEAIEEGVVAVTRKIARARKEGIAEGRAQVFEMLEAAGLDQATLKAQGCDLEALAA